MQQIKPITQGQVGGYLMPEKSKNKNIVPVKKDLPGFGFDGKGGDVGITNTGHTQYSTNNTPIDEQPLYHGGPNPSPYPHRPAVSDGPAAGRPGGLLNPDKITPQQSVSRNNYQPTPYQSVTQQAQANAPQANLSQPDYVADGRLGVTSDKQYQYDPRADSLVENRITGLLNSDSALMRKAIAQGNAMAANRGLQSSSIGQEIALSTMVDKALPIAQQDAQTFNQAQSQQWQAQAQLDQANLKHAQEATMMDKSLYGQNQLQNNQAQQQAELEQLKHLQSLGKLDAEGAQRMQELNTQLEFQAKQLDRQQELTLQRDAIMNQYQVELNELQNNQRWKELTAQLSTQMEMQLRGFDQQTRIEYGNATSTAVNAALAAIGMAMTNPEMTAIQQREAVNQIISSLQSQTNILSVVYGITHGGDNVEPPDIGLPNPPVNPPPPPSPGGPGSGGHHPRRGGGGIDPGGRRPYVLV